jgi:glycerophosphoryl diester phosphodiesterase
VIVSGGSPYFCRMKWKREIGELLLTMLFVIGCHTAKNLSLNLPAFDTEAHRGGRGLMPENTIPAMLNGLEFGITTLEMDAVITKDNKVILSHEPFFNHEITTQPNGAYIEEKEEKSFNIYHMTYQETQQYDVGMKSHPRFAQQRKVKATKPLLSDVIEQAEAYAVSKGRAKPFYNIETKSQPVTDNIYHPAPGAFVELLISVIKDKKIEDRVIIQSFDPRTLQIVHNRYPHIKTALLIEDFDKRSLDEQLQQLGFVPTIYSPAYKLVNETLLTSCHQKQIKVIAWTVNDKAEIEKLKAMGVDGIISDYPNLFTPAP